MEREFPPPRAGLQGSPLLDLLAQLALAERPAAPPSFVEGLGRWLGWKEAIPLSAVQRKSVVLIDVPVFARDVLGPKIPRCPDLISGGNPAQHCQMLSRRSISPRLY